LPARLAEIRHAHPTQRLLIFHQDEARFGQQGTLTRVWAPKGSRPAAVRQTEYAYLWVVGAVCAETGQAEAILAPHLNTDVMNVFLREFSRSLASDVHAVLLWDGAGFHRSGKLQVPENVSLVELPPYSPQLNPIENLWHYLRSHHWSNRWYADYDALMDAAIDAWRKVALVPNTVKSVCRAKYLEPYQPNRAVIR
jgi:transposase